MASKEHGYDTTGVDGRKRSETAHPKSSPRAGRRPVDPETRKAIEDMAREGTRSRNQVAREFGVAPSTVTLICREAEPPITFDRSKTEVAVKAHQIDLKAKRAELAELLLLDAFVLREAALKDKVVRILTEGMVEEGVTDPVEFEVEREGRDIQARYTALGIAVDKHMVIVRADSDDRDLPAVEVFLRGQGVPGLFGQ